MPETLSAMGLAGLWGWVVLVAVVLVYLTILRLVDMNEREPLGLIVGVTVIGAVGGALFGVIDFSQQDPTTYTVIESLIRFGVVSLAFAAIFARGRRQGWPEINGLLDGIIYGSAVGMGFALGGSMVSVIGYGSEIFGAAGVSPWEVVGDLAVSGLHAAVLGGLMGLGFAIWRLSTVLVWRASGLIGGLVIATGVAVGRISFGAAIGTFVAEPWATVAWLAIPVVLMATIATIQLRSERQAIRRFLVDESEHDAVVAEAVSQLGPGRSSRVWWRALSGGNVGRFLAERQIANHLAELALLRQYLSTHETGQTGQEQLATLRGVIKHEASGLSVHNPPRTGPAIRGISTLLLVALVTTSAGLPPTVGAANRVTLDKTRYLTLDEEYNVSAGYYAVAAKAAPFCPTWAYSLGYTWLSTVYKYGVRRNIAVWYATAIWSAATNKLGVSWCDIATQMARGALWAGYYWAVRQRVNSRIYIWQEDRTLAIDRCHWYHAIGGYWRINDMKTAVVPLSGGCPTA